jgi:hypothetical protein
LTESAGATYCEEDRQERSMETRTQTDSNGRHPYESPQLVDYGTLRELTGTKKNESADQYGGQFHHNRFS